MIELKKAYEIALDDAKKQYANVEVLSCTDIGDRFAFAIGANNEPLIGAPSFAVDKESGDLTYLSIPPIENLKLLKNGTKIDIAFCKQA